MTDSSNASAQKPKQSAAPTVPPDLQAWERAAAKSAPGGNLADLVWHTPDGIAVKPLYTAQDTAGLPHTGSLPGFEPYLRGPQATMYAVRIRAATRCVADRPCPARYRAA